MQNESPDITAKNAQLPLTVTRDALLVDGSDARFRDLINGLLLLSGQLQWLRVALSKQLGVTEPQYRVLLTVARLQGRTGVSVTAAANALRVTGAFVTAESRKLQRKGLLEKREDPHDRRGVLLALSRFGHQTLVEFGARPQQVNDELFRDITREEFEMLHTIVGRLLANSERAKLVAQALDDNDGDATFLSPLPNKHAIQIVEHSTSEGAEDGDSMLFGPEHT